MLLDNKTGTPPELPYSSQLALTVSVSSPSGTTKVGFVSVYAGENLLATVAVDDGGIVDVVDTGLEPGVYDLEARYGGSGNLEAVRSPLVTVTVNKAVPTFNIDYPARLRTNAVGEISARVTAPGGAPASGPVDLIEIAQNGSESLADTVDLDDDGVAIFSCAAEIVHVDEPCGPLALGPHTFKIRRAISDELIDSGDSAPFPIMVEPPIAATISATAPAVAYTQSYFRVELGVERAGGDFPDGQVRLTDPADPENVLDEGEIDDNGYLRLTAKDIVGPTGPRTYVLHFEGDAITDVASAEFSVDIRQGATIAMTTPKRVTAAGSRSEQVELALLQSDGSPMLAPAGGIEINLGSSSSASYFYPATDTASSDDLRSITVAEGESTVSLWITNASAGSHQLLAKAPDVGIDRSHRFRYDVIRGGPAEIVVLPSLRSAAIGSESKPYKVFAADAYGNELGDVTSASALTGTSGTTCEAATGTCTPSTAGTHEIIATYDALSATSELIANTEPVPEVLLVETDPGDDRDFTFTLQATDADGDDLTYLVDWGDGSATTEVEDVPDGPFTVSHLYGERPAAMVMRVADGIADPTWTSHQIDGVRPADLLPSAGDDRVVNAGDPVHFDGSGSKPDLAQLGYLWDFGDGSSSTEVDPDHTYAEPGSYTVELRVRRGATTSNPHRVTVTVADPDGTGVFVALSSGGLAVSGAAVVVNTADGKAHRGVETSSGSGDGTGNYLLVDLPEGQHSIYAYREGYVPTVVGFVATGGVDMVAIDLEPGAAAEAEVTTRRMSYEDAVNLGVTFASTDASLVTEFKIEIPKKNKHLNVYRKNNEVVCSTDDDLFLKRNQPPEDRAVGSCDVFFGGGGGGMFISRGGDAVVIMNKTRASWAKEVFEVTLEVINISPTGFSLAPGTATVNLPVGLSLAEMEFEAQQATVGTNEIDSGRSSKTQWFVRGDIENEYHLSVDYSAVLDPVGEPVSVRAETDDDSKIRVWGRSALRAQATADQTVEPDHPHRQQLSITNVADVPVYNLSLGLVAGSDGQLVQTLAQPRQKGQEYVAQIAPGATATAPESRLLYDRGFVLPDTIDTVGDDPLVALVTSQAPLPRLPVPVLDTPPSDFGAAGVKISWEPVDDALRYAVFSTADREYAFPSEPIAETVGPEAEVDLPAQEGYGLLAVSAVFERDGEEVYEMVHPLVPTGTLALTPDARGIRDSDPCRGYGSDPLVSFPGNFVSTATDASVNALGLPLAVTRTYNSMDPFETGLGTGWSSNLSIRGFIDQDGNIGLKLQDGSCITAQQTSPGIYDVLGRSENWSATSHLEDRDAYSRIVNHTDRVIYRLDYAGRLEWIEDVQGRKTMFGYEELGPDEWADEGDLNPLSVTDEASGRRLHLEWDGEGRLSSVKTDPVTDPSGTAALEWGYYYDGDNLSSVCDPRDPTQGGSCEVYGYDDENRLVTVIDRESNVSTVSYDTKGRMSRLHAATGAITSFGYPEGSDGTQEVATTDPLGNTTVATYDASYRLIGATGPGGDATVGYDSQGYLKTLSGPGQTMTIDSDLNGTPEQIASPAGTAWFGIENGDVTERTSPAGSDRGDSAYTSTMTYDDGHRPTQSITPPTGRSNQPMITTWSYTEAATPAVGGGATPEGLISAETRPVPTGYAADAAETTFGYDQTGNRVVEVSPTGVTTTRTFDELGRVTSQEVDPPDGDPVLTTYENDEMGNVVKTTGAVVTDEVTGETHQLLVTATFDGNSRRTHVAASDVDGGALREAITSYDPLGRVLDESVRVDAGRVALTQHRYDAVGNEVETIDAEGTIIRRVFDDANRETEEWIQNYSDPNQGGAEQVLVQRSIWDQETGRKTSDTDALGRKTTYGYDTAGRLKETVLNDVDDGTGATADYVVEEVSYNRGGQVDSRITANGTRTTDYVHDSLGRVTQETFDPAGLARVTSHEFDEAGNPTVTRLTGDLPNGYDRPEQTISVYDGAGRVLNRTVKNDLPGDSDLVTVYTHDAMGKQLTATDPNGNVTANEYDVLGELIKTTGAAVDGSGVFPATSFGRDVFGQATSVRGPLGEVSATEFNSAGKMTSTTSVPYVRPSDGQTLTATTNYTYDLLGRLIEVATPGSGVRKSFYDSRGSLVRSESPGPEPAEAVVYTSRFDDAGRLIESVAPSGLTNRTTYDGLNRAVATVQEVAGVNDSPGHTATTRQTFDDASNVVSTVDAAGGVATSAFNVAGDMTSSVSPQQHELGTDLPVTYSHDPAGRVVESTDETGRKTATTFDLAGRVTAESSYDAESGSWLKTERTYDANGNLLTEASPRGVAEGWATTFTYDAADRLTRVVEPVDAVESITTQFGYDLNGNQTSVTDGRGNETVQTFNSWDLLETVVEPATAATPNTPERTFVTSYDEASRPVSRTEPGGITITSTFDGAGNLTGETGTSTDPATPDSLRRMRWDTAGRLVASDNPEGEVTYSYDQRGLLIGQNNSDGSDLFTYNDAGQITERVDDRGTALFSWGTDGLLDEMVDPVSGRHFSYQYDDAGRTTQTVANTPGFDPYSGDGDRQTTTLGYDALGRRNNTEVTGTDGEPRYQEQLVHDVDGNVTSRTIAGPNAPTDAQGSGSFTYDRAGRLTSMPGEDDTTTVIGWDHASNRTAVGDTTFTFDERNRVVSGTDGTAIGYSPAGARTSVTTADGTNRDLTVDALGQPVTDGDIDYTWDSQGRIATRTESGETQVFNYQGQDLDPTIAGDTRRGTDPGGLPLSVDDEVVTTNKHGDVVAATNPDGVTNTAGYDAFGATNNPNLAGPYGYQSDWTDPTNDTVWMGARSYDPTTASFTNRDTWAGNNNQPVTLNRYTYGNANPINHTDPTGRNAVSMETRIGQFLSGGAVATAAMFMWHTMAAESMAAVWAIFNTNYAVVNLGRAAGNPGLMASFGSVAPMAIALVLIIINAMTVIVVAPSIRDMSTDVLDRPIELVGEAEDLALEAAVTVVLEAQDRLTQEKKEVSDKKNRGPKVDVCENPVLPLVLGTDTCGADLVPVWFGQRRINATYTGGGSILGPTRGAIPVFMDPRTPGVYIALGNRRLAGYSLKSATAAPACVRTPTRNEMKRLNGPKETPIPPQASLPSPFVSVTESQDDLTPVAPYLVTSTVFVPRVLPPC